MNRVDVTVAVAVCVSVTHFIGIYIMYVFTRSRRQPFNLAIGEITIYANYRFVDKLLITIMRKNIIANWLAFIVVSGGCYCLMVNCFRLLNFNELSRNRTPVTIINRELVRYQFFIRKRFNQTTKREGNKALSSGLAQFRFHSFCNYWCCWTNSPQQFCRVDWTVPLPFNIIPILS